MQYPLTSLLARLSTGTGRGFLVASFHTALVLSLTLPLSPVGRQVTSEQLLLLKTGLPRHKKKRKRIRKDSKDCFTHRQGSVSPTLTAATASLAASVTLTHSESGTIQIQSQRRIFTAADT
ncbi:hypothetical protein VNO77_50005 [Canavalia gladiata]|uniref:Uncharacterized protein n=1 Tax=Canavalia gladiata TaxID=3824 RepID=A0AAN9PGW5_CANGL